MEHQDLLSYLENSGKDPSRLIFEDELTGLYNRRYLYHYFQSKVPWGSLDVHPFSLLMMDMDYFKQVNDNYGHQIGDQALVWLAGLLKGVAGKEGMPIRYAGDEFMILLKDCDKSASMQLGGQLLQHVRENQFQLNDHKGSLNITISLGIASAPQDARTGRGLIQKADTALYSAKKNGRNQLVNAGDVNPEEVFAKTAINQLKEVKIVGRGRQLALVSDALKQFSLRQNRFLLAEGAAGMGKSEFLEAIRRNLARSKTWQVKVSGNSQEMFRPYYLTARIVESLLKLREDLGRTVFESLNPSELTYLAPIMPQLEIMGAPSVDENESGYREGIFRTLLQFIHKIIDERPLILLIDDLQFSDLATLLLFRQLILHGGFPIFICGTSSVSPDPATKEETIPLDRFFKKYHEDLSIQKFTLTPLTAADINKHIQGLFPNVHLPKNFDEELTRISQGNPLFFGEILRKLVLDEKITLVGQQWVFTPLEKGYLPRSLEEIVSGKIATLDEESKQMLDQVSAMGEGVPLSMLTGSSEEMEAKILEFIDKAATQGLLSSDFEVNDEVVRFLGKRILEITYGAIEPERKEKIHERIGNYHETLYQQKLLPSAATLAYHFKRSTDQEKAGNYEQILTTTNSKNFNAEEAAYYANEELSEGLSTDAPIRPEDVPLIPKVMRDFMVAVRNIKLYPPGSKSIISVTGQSKKTFDQILQNNETFNLAQIKQKLVVNGQEINSPEFKKIAGSFLQFLDRYELKGIAFHKGLTDEELEVLLETFGRTQLKIFDQQYWKRFSAENQLDHIDLKQMRYTMKGKPPLTDSIQDTAKSSESDPLPVATDRHQSGMADAEPRLLPALLKRLLGAARIIKLYPLKSKAVSSAIGHLMETLGSILKHQKVVTLSQASNTMHVNGKRVDVTDYKTFAVSFVKLLKTIGLSSLTFTEDVTVREVETLIDTFGKILPDGAESEFWKKFANEEKFSGIFFDKQIYEIRAAQTQLVTEKTDGIAEDTSAAEDISATDDMMTEEPIPEENFENFLSEFQTRIQHFLDSGAAEKFKQATHLLFLGFQNRSLPIREKIVNICRSSLENLPSAFQHDFTKFLADPLLNAFFKEKESKIIVEMAALLNRLFVNLVEFVEFPLAARILAQLKRRYQELKTAGDSHAQKLTKSLGIRLNPITQNLLIADLKSGDSIRQRNASQLLETLGQVATPLLIDIIKQEEDYRSRQTAATLLAKQGSKAAERLKRLLVLEITAEERARVLQVIDTVTKDLTTELLHALEDENHHVRLAAFRLTERMNDKRMVAPLIENAKTLKGQIAVAAVNTLGKLKPPDAVEALSSLLNSTKEEELRTACCRALGQIANPDCIEPLSNVLNQKKLVFRRPRYSDQVRATAAFALGHIAHPQAVKTLSQFVNDADQRIRAIAQTAVKTARSTPRRKSVEVSIVQ
ncbi:MAG: diguanylate cyclase [Deltaproteobacteria bacterium]|nr:MAG: diguanylate cyclase [Deltaproteobacteria bacterium]